MEKFRVLIFKNRIIQISSKDEKRDYSNYWETDLYNIYIDEKLYTDVFKFDTELEFEKLLNAKSVCLKQFKN